MSLLAGQGSSIGKELYPVSLVKSRMGAILIGKLGTDGGKDMFFKTIAKSLINKALQDFRFLVSGRDRECPADAIDGQGFFGAVQFQFRCQSFTDSRCMGKNE